MRIGIDLGGTKIAGIVLDNQGRAVAEHRTATPQGDYSATLQAVAHAVQALEEQLPEAPAEPLPLGMATPGSVSPLSGAMRNCNSTCLNGQFLQQDLQTLLNRPLRLANDANCFALSEAVDGAAANAASVFGVIIGTGVGGGLVVGQKLLPGLNGIGGELGHNPVPWPVAHEHNRRCYCGRVNCIETWLSGPALLQSYQQGGPQHRAANAEDIVALAEQGDALAQQVLTTYHQRLAQALAVVVNILDPDAIVLGGGLGQLPQLANNVAEGLGQHVFADQCNTPVLLPTFGAASGVRGAARLFPAG